MIKRNLIISSIVILLAIILRMIVYYTHSQFSGLGVFQNIITLLFLLPAVFIAIKQERDQHPLKSIDFKNSLKTGLLVSVFCGIGIGTFSIIYFEYVDTGFVAALIEKTKTIAAEKNISEQKLFDVIAKIKEDFSGFRQGTKAIMYMLITGLVFSLISAGFLVRQSEQDEQLLN